LSLAASILLMASACSAVWDRPPASPEAEVQPIPDAMRPLPGRRVAGLPDLAAAPPASARAAVDRARTLPQRRLYETGLASWYGPGFEGRLTATGEVYDSSSMTAAHKELPLGSEVVVVNLANGREARLRINDRGPFVGTRVIDVSKAAAEALGFYYAGLAEVRVDLLLPSAVERQTPTPSG